MCVLNYACKNMSLVLCTCMTYRPPVNPGVKGCPFNPCLSRKYTQRTDLSSDFTNPDRTFMSFIMSKIYIYQRILKIYYHSFHKMIK